MTDMSVSPTVPCQTDRLRKLATEIRMRYRDLLPELRIECDGEHVVLYGRASSYYGKQMAQEEVIRLGNLSVLANRIQVGTWSQNLLA